MGWAGKIIGGTIGLAVAGPVGAVIGGLIGNSFDKKAGQQPGQERLNKQEQSQMVFFTTTFSMLAKFAQADGEVSRSEVNVIDDFVRNELNLDPKSRQLAIQIFDEAKQKQASFEDFARQFHQYFRQERALLVSMLDLLTRIAAADNRLHKKEKEYLEKARQIFNISDSQYESIKARYIQEDDLDKYYKILELSPGASISEVKKQYREKAREFHPDNVIGKGLPEEFVDFAEEKFKRIQNAYEKIMEAKRAG